MLSRNSTKILKINSSLSMSLSNTTMNTLRLLVLITSVLLKEKWILKLQISISAQLCLVAIIKFLKVMITTTVTQGNRVQKLPSSMKVHQERHVFYPDIVILRSKQLWPVRLSNRLTAQLSKECNFKPNRINKFNCCNHLSKPMEEIIT